MIPEIETTPDEVARKMRKAYERVKAHALAVVAEGAEHNAEAPAAYFREHTARIGCDLRVTTLAHVQRGGAPTAYDRLRLSYLHEFAHFQTLPFVLLHLLLLLGSALRNRRSLTGLLVRLAALVLAVAAVWELVSEAYVVSRDCKAYRETYRETPNPLLPFFWAGLGGLGIGLSRFRMPRLHTPDHVT